MTKALRKAIMTRSRLKNIYLKSRNEENRVNYKRQQNFCTNLLRKTEQKYFCNLNMKDLNDNKKVWKKIKPFFSDKGLQTNNIVLKDKNRLVTDSSIFANIFNNYFINITNTLNLKHSMPKSKSFSDLLKLYEDHFSALKIKNIYEILNISSSLEKLPRMK